MCDFIASSALTPVLTETFAGARLSHAPCVNASLWRCGMGVCVGGCWQDHFAFLANK